MGSHVCKVRNLLASSGNNEGGNSQLHSVLAIRVISSCLAHGNYPVREAVASRQEDTASVSKSQEILQGGDNEYEI